MQYQYHPCFTMVGSVLLWDETVVFGILETTAQILAA